MPTSTVTPTVADVKDVSQREGYIGGSDYDDLTARIAPTQATYGCPRRLWYVKRGADPDYPEDVSAPMRRGTRLEHVAVEMYEEQSGRTTTETAVIPAPGLPEWWGGHPDRMINANSDGRGNGVLEVKTVGERMWTKIKREGVPPRMVAQLHHYLGLTGCRWGVLFIYHPDGDQTLLLVVERDEEMLGLMRNVGEWFMRCVTEGPAPDRLDARDSRCQRCQFRHTCQGVAILEACADDTGEITKSDDPQLVKLLREERDAAELAKEADEVLEVLRERVRQAMWNMQAVEAGGFRAYFRSVTMHKIDTKRLRAEQPEIAKQYSREVVTRPLRVFAV